MTLAALCCLSCCRMNFGLVRHLCDEVRFFKLFKLAQCCMCDVRRTQLSDNSSEVTQLSVHRPNEDGQTSF